MSKRAIFITLFIFIFGIGIGALISASKTSDNVGDERSAGIQEASKSGDLTGSGAEQKGQTFVVSRVIDGDTIELEDGRKVRYIGIDTPETVDPSRPVECFGKEASEKNKNLVLEKKVELEKDVSETDRYGRLLRYVYVDLPGEGRVMINEILVKEGFASSSTYPPDVKYQNIFQEAEKQARLLNVGLWGSCSLSSPLASPVSSSSKTETIDAVTNTNTNQNVEKSGSQNSTNEGGCLIKGNISSSKEKIYHLPGCGSYEKTVIDEAAGERWFCTESEAVDAGWRKAKNC